MDDLLDIVHRNGVNSREWFVQKHELRPLYQGSGNFQPAALPAREGVSFVRSKVCNGELIEKLLQPNLRVGELVKALEAYYRDQGIWEDASWLGGYEMGIGFPPDWVGNFVFEMSHEDSEVLFEPGTAVNYESVFYGPRMSGLTYLIDSLLFKEDTAELASRMPRELIVLDV